MQLTIVQNRTLRAETIIWLLICSGTFSSYVVGGFGMNLNNYSQLSGGFAMVCVFTLVGIVLVFYGIVLSLIWAKMFPSLNTFRQPY